LLLFILGINEASQFVSGRSLKCLHNHRLAVSIVLRFIAQYLTYREKPVPPSTPARAAQLPNIIAENPDHAGLAAKVDDLTERLRTSEKERDIQQNLWVVSGSGNAPSVW
jgi:hypothetical protein